MQAFHKEDISVLAQIFTPKMFACWSHQMGRVVSCIAFHPYIQGGSLLRHFLTCKLNLLLPFFMDFNHKLKQFTLPLERLSLKSSCLLQINIVLFNHADCIFVFSKVLLIFYLIQRTQLSLEDWMNVWKPFLTKRRYVKPYFQKSILDFWHLLQHYNKPKSRWNQNFAWLL